MLLLSNMSGFVNILHVFSSHLKVTTSPQRYPFCYGRWVGSSAPECVVRTFLHPKEQLPPRDSVSGLQRISSSRGTIICGMQTVRPDCEGQICNFLHIYCILKTSLFSEVLSLNLACCENTSSLIQNKLRAATASGIETAGEGVGASGVLHILFFPNLCLLAALDRVSNPKKN